MSLNNLNILFKRGETMQQTELLEILPELKAKVENYKLYGTTNPTEWDISNRNFNLWRERKEQQDIKLYELVRDNPQILSSVR